LVILYEEMAMLLSFFDEVGRINYCVNGAKELLQAEMIEWFKPFVSILYVYSCND